MKKRFAKYLRVNSTDAEAVLWYNLRNRRFFRYKFRRQMPIGRFIVDFFCIETKLIIEIDGGQHSEQIVYDLNRTKILNSKGYKVIRFWNNDVLTNLDGVLECIRQELH